MARRDASCWRRAFRDGALESTYERGATRASAFFRKARPRLSMIVMALIVLGSLAVLFLLGAGAASMLAANAPRDAQAALAPVVAAALLVCVSQLHFLDLPVRATIIVFATGSMIATAVKRAAVRRLLAGSMVPLVIAASAIGLAASPSLANGSWEVTTFGNTDPYLWVSEARAMLDGPSPGPSSDYPDRKAYEAIDALDFPVGIPTALAALSWGGQSDPKNIYGAFAALVVGLLTLSVYFAARGVLEWRKRTASLAAAATGGNAYLLFASYYGWQAQLLLTTFAFAAVVCFRRCLDSKATGREIWLAGLLLAAAFATYSWAAFAFFPFAALVVIGVLATHRPRPWRDLARVTALVAVAAAAAGPLVITRAIESVNGIRQTAPSWSAYSPAYPSDALGLVPRALVTLSTGWSLLAIGVSAPLLYWGIAARRGGRYTDFATFVGAGVIAWVLILRMAFFSPYVSIKVAGYAAPVFVLVALRPLADPQRLRKAHKVLLATAAMLFVGSTLVMTVSGALYTERPPRVAKITEALAAVPKTEPVSLRVARPWDQAWILYALRDRRVLVDDPAEFLVGFGRSPAEAALAHGPPAVTIRRVGRHRDRFAVAVKDTGVTRELARPS